MEELCRSVCNKIYTSTREGYGIFYEDELLDAIPDGERTREALEAALKQLVNGGYIDVKYAKGNAFCIMGLKNYEEPVPLPPPAPQGKMTARKKFYALAFAAAFAGGALGSLICELIFYAV